ncbi:DEAD/DEAH box helicase [Actinoplanes sp. NPDC089786]|uniref:DEAD/DEAH box helicase n=1 Tax=Actinoplanes sp. NPDC089786 TaxID=3155185 RepID=UPI003442935F
MTRVLHGVIARDGAFAVWAEVDAAARPHAAASPAFLGSGPEPSALGSDSAGADLAARSGSATRVAPAADPGGDEAVPPAEAADLGEAAAQGGNAGHEKAPAQGEVVFAPSRRRGEAAWHPFAAGVEGLPDGDARGPLTLLLPSVTSGPLASPQLGLAARRGKPRWQAWQVAAVSVPFVSADVADDDDRIGPSLAYLVEVCAFAADLVARGRVLPGVWPDGMRPRAYWRAVLTGPDVTRHAELLRRMPAACRAERLRPGDTDGRPAAELLHAALDRLIDGLVRTRLAEAGVTLSGEPWLTALTDDGSPTPARPPAALTTTKAAAAGRPTALARDEPSEADEGLGAHDAALAGGEPPRIGDGPAGPEREETDDEPGGVGRQEADEWPERVPGEFEAAPEVVHALTEMLDAWHAEAAGGAAVRVVFRLSHLQEMEPDLPDATGGAVEAPAEDAWLVEFLLQPLDEPSVLVTAGDVWRDEIAPLRRWTHRPQERLLAGLGRAARLVPELDGALRVARPVDLVLTTEGAHRFLTCAGVLEQAGYGVMVPAWWRDRPGLGLALDVRTPEPIAPVLRDRTANLASMVDYNWGLALGGRVLTEDELSDLAKVKVPLVRLRGRWVHLDPERLAAGLAFLGRGGGSMTAGDALRMIRLLPPEELPLPVTAVSGAGWAAGLLSGDLDERLELIDQPPDLIGVLRPYQRRGFSWLSFMDGLGLGACLADDMGLGKTVQLLALLLHARRGPTLLICPLSVLGNWQREAARFAPSLRVRVWHGAEREAAVDCDVLLTTYGTAAKDHQALAAMGWDRIVLDEAQHIKNSASAVAKAVRRIPARSRIALTGTPVENRLAELWSILDFLNPGVLAGAPTFRARFAVPIERYSDEDAAHRLRQATRPFLLRREKADASIINDLPDKRHVRHLCGLTAEQATLYQAVLDDMLERMGEASDRRKGYVLATMTKLKQVCNHPAQLLGDGSPLPGRSGKLERLEEILDAVLAAGERALCFTQFTRFGSMLTPHLAARFGVPVRYLHGGTPRAERDRLVAEFQADTRPGIFVLSLKAGGTGLNLTAANHVVHVDRWWNPATEAQATDRAFRIGQHRDVQVHTLTCLGTLEERIDGMIAEKGTLAERVVGNGESWLTTLSTAELRDLLALSPEAVGD